MLWERGEHGTAWGAMEEGWVEEEEDIHELDLKDACHQYLPSV